HREDKLHEATMRPLRLFDSRLVGPILLALVFAVALAPPCSAQARLDPYPSVTVGTDNSTAIKNAPPAWYNIGRPVARVDTPRECGSGFLISDDCFLTCAHVVSGQTAADVKLWFDYEDKTSPYENHRGCATDPDGACSTPDIWTATSVTILSPAESLDCALIKVAPKNGMTAGQVYGKVTVNFREPVKDEQVYVIGHPGGGCKEWSTDDQAKVINV